MKINLTTSIVFVALLSTAACTRSSVMPIANDTVQISTHVAPVCPSVSAQTIAVKRAAVETINRGFDKFLILGANMQAEFAGYLPGQSTTTGSGMIIGNGNMATIQGSSNTTYMPPTPMTSHTETILVKMFKDGDSAGSNAISAKSTLGPDWEKVIKESSTSTC